MRAAEKYAELEAAGLERPRCKCHGEPMGWNKDDRIVSGGWWRCAEKLRLSVRRWCEENPERKAEWRRRWREKNPEKVQECNARRLRIGGLYLGMCGFTETEREAMLDGSS